jgi:hypothetical protein
MKLGAQVSADSADGSMWPVFLEWGSSGWSRKSEVKDLINNEVMKGLVEKSVFLFDSERLTRVFKGVEASKFSDISHAIETRIRVCT